MNCHYADDIGLDLSTIALELKNEEILNNIYNIKNQINNQVNTNESDSNDESNYEEQPSYKNYNSSPKKILPVHWTIYYDSNHNCNYYYNKITQVSQWTFPVDDDDDDDSDDDGR